MSKVDTKIDAKFPLNSKLYDYLQEMISNLPNGSKLVMTALANNDYNKEDLSLKAGVRRGELNYVICWVEALGFVTYSKGSRQKLYKLTKLGETVLEEFGQIFTTLKEDDAE